MTAGAPGAPDPPPLPDLPVGTTAAEGTLADDVRTNREHWDRTADEYQAAHGPQLAAGTRWGLWALPEAEVGALGDLTGARVLELGCGAADWTLALRAGGVAAVGLDQSDGQLRHARRRREETGIAAPLVQASGDAVPFAGGSFDVVFCDHGALSYLAPERSLPEVARLLRPGGRLAFNMVTPLHDVCWSDEEGAVVDRLERSYFDDLVRWEDEHHVEWQRTYGEWIRLFRRTGFVVEDLVELRPPEGATSTYDLVAADWARHWPAEHIWIATRAG